MIAVPLVVAAGAALSLQAFLNGRLSHSIGSPELAATVNNLVGFFCLFSVAVATGVPRRAVESLRSTEPLRWWHPIMGINGALFITVTAYAAPRVGVALLTVALVCGQTAGGIGVDRAGIAPGGRRPLTVTRLAGALLAIIAIVLAASQAPGGDLQLGILALAVIAGAGLSFQQAAIGHVRRATGEPLAAAGMNFFAGAVAIVIVALIVTGGTPPDGWSSSPWYWLAGILGASVAVVMALTVSRLGVLVVTLGLVAGQSLGALAIDIVAPPDGEHITVLTVVSVLLVVVAVVVSGRPGSPLALRRASAAPTP